MGMFGRRRPFMPPIEAAVTGQLPGAIVEDWSDPYFVAQQIGAPVPADPLAPLNGNGAGPEPYFANPQPNVTGPYPGGQLPPEARVPANTPDSSPTRSMYGGPIPAGDTGKKKSPVGSFLQNFAGFYGDKLTGNPVYADSLKHKRDLEKIDRKAQTESRLPQQVGSSMIVPDGRGGYKTLFRDPSTPEAYALAQGHEPGTAEYATAVQQYRLGAWSDEAVEAKTGFAGYRYDRMGNLQDDRQGHASGMQDDRQQHSDGQFGRRLDVTRRGQDIGRDNNIRSTGQSDTNNQRSTDVSRGNNVRSNETRLQTARGRRDGAGTAVRVKTLEQARRLRPGTLFQTPDGRIKVR